VVSRNDAYRCTIANELYDPCFSTSASQVLCPTQGPWSNTGVLIDTPGGLPSTAGIKDTGTSGQPWAIELADGTKCLPISGASNVIANQRLNFDCTGGVGLYGNVQRSSPTWEIYVGEPHSALLKRGPIAIAWY
jgi:hypothetical protein